MFKVTLRNNLINQNMKNTYAQLKF